MIVGHLEIEFIVLILLIAAMQWFGKLPKLLGTSPWADFVRANFDKLLLFVVFVGCMLYVRRSIAYGADDAFINWAQGVTGQVLAALVAIMQVTKGGKNDPPPPQIPPSPPVPPLTPSQGGS